MSWGVDRRCSLDPKLLWPADTALIRPLAWEPPYAAGVALEKTKKKKNQKGQPQLLWPPGEGGDARMGPYSEGESPVSSAWCSGFFDGSTASDSIDGVQVWPGLQDRQLLLFASWGTRLEPSHHAVRKPKPEERPIWKGTSGHQPAST